MTAIMNDARTTLAQTFTSNKKPTKTFMDSRMQRLLAECSTNEKRAELWNRNPMTGATVAGIYNDRLRG